MRRIPHITFCAEWVVSLVVNVRRGNAQLDAARPPNYDRRMPFDAAIGSCAFSSFSIQLAAARNRINV
jgi:hypothetical protein